MSRYQFLRIRRASTIVIKKLHKTATLMIEKFIWKMRDFKLSFEAKNSKHVIQESFLFLPTTVFGKFILRK